MAGAGAARSGRHKAHIARDRPLVAEEWARKITSKAGSLAQLPYLGEVYSREHLFVIREVLVGPYRIFYEIDEAKEEVSIVTIHHAARMEPGDMGI